MIFADFGHGRTAARIGTARAALAFPEIPRQLAARLSVELAPASADLRRASGLIERTLDCLARALRPGAVGLTAREERESGS